MRRPPCQLQWGRRPESAEGTSTGRNMKGRRSLQWGRRPESAEGLGPQRVVRSRARFNGAADLSPRKAAPPAPPAKDVVLASMGPQT